MSDRTALSRLVEAARESVTLLRVARVALGAVTDRVPNAVQTVGIARDSLADTLAAYDAAESSPAEPVRHCEGCRGNVADCGGVEHLDHHLVGHPVCPGIGKEAR